MLIRCPWHLKGDNFRNSIDWPACQSSRTQVSHFGTDFAPNLICETIAHRLDASVWRVRLRGGHQARVGRHAKSAGSPQRTGDREVCGKAELSNTLSLLAR